MQVAIVFWADSKWVLKIIAGNFKVKLCQTWDLVEA